MAAATTVSGQLQTNFTFTETLSSGYINPLSLPASISGALTYQNASSGSNAIDLLVATQLTLSASATTLDLTSVSDLGGTARTFARVREFVVQNIGSASVKVYANSTSGVPWLPSGSTSALVAYAATSTSGSTAGGKVYLSDPWTTGGSTGQYILTGSSKVVFDPGTGSTSVNVIIAGTSTAS